MQTVVANSGGAAWSRVRSSKEVFRIAASDNSASRVGHFLDDWSTEVTRYRRGTAGKQKTPEEHSGNPTYSATVGTQKLTVPEFDQARAIVGRLPAAAAEIMLRNSNYIVKTATTRSCQSGSVCIDIFERSGSGLAFAPEQQWTISSTTGLPTTIATSVFAIGPPHLSRWRVIRFVKYGSEENLFVPTSVEVAGPIRGKEVWTLVSFTANPGFDKAKFDQEVAQ